MWTCVQPSSVFWMASMQEPQLAGQLDSAGFANAQQDMLCALGMRCRPGFDQARTASA